MGKTGALTQVIKQGPIPRENSSDVVTEESLPSRLKDIVEAAAKKTGAACVFLLLCDPVTQGLRNVAWYGRKEVPESIVTLAQRLILRRTHSYNEDVPRDRGTADCSLIKTAQPTIYIPVMSNAAPRGVLAVAWPSSDAGTLSHWLPFLESQAELSGVLLESAELQRELCRKQEQVQDLIRDTLGAEEAERERVCLEVHDGVAQTLASAFQYLQSLESTTPTQDIQTRQLLLKATSLVKQAIQESRDVINSLQPATLMDLGLVATLRQEMKRLEEETGWKVEFEADNTRLPKSAETGLYRLIHEAIANARRHAHTKRLRVKITAADDKIKVEVRDWGVGFYLPPDDRRRVLRRRGTGLLSMRKRAELLQGSCDIKSSPGQGTTVHVEIPLSG